MRKANRPKNGKVGSGFLHETEHNGTEHNGMKHNGYRVFVGKRTLTAVQNRPLLRRRLKGMDSLWLGYMRGLQRGG